MVVEDELMRCGDHEQKDIRGRRPVIPRLELGDVQNPWGATPPELEEMINGRRERLDS